MSDETGEPWPNQAYIPDDDVMGIQLPRDDPHPTYVAETGDIGPEGHGYPIAYDRVIALDRTKYTELEAKMRFNSICVITGCRPTEAPFYTARHWCMRVVNKRENQ